MKNDILYRFRSIRFSKGLCPIYQEGAKHVQRRAKSHRADFAYSSPRKTDFFRRASAYAGFNQERTEKQMKHPLNCNLTNRHELKVRLFDGWQNRVTQFTGQISTIYNERRWDNGTELF